MLPQHTNNKCGIDRMSWPTLSLHQDLNLNQDSAFENTSLCLWLNQSCNKNYYETYIYVLKFGQFLKHESTPYTYQCFIEEGKVPDPLINPGLDWSHMARAGDGGDVHLGVVQKDLDIVCSSQDEDVLGVPVGQDNKLCCLPCIFNLYHIDKPCYELHRIPIILKLGIICIYLWRPLSEIYIISAWTSSEVPCETFIQIISNTLILFF